MSTFTSITDHDKEFQEDVEYTNLYLCILATLAAIFLTMCLIHTIQFVRERMKALDEFSWILATGVVSMACFVLSITFLSLNNLIFFLIFRPFNIESDHIQYEFAEQSQIFRLLVESFYNFGKLGLYFLFILRLTRPFYGSFWQLPNLISRVFLSLFVSNSVLFEIAVVLLNFNTTNGVGNDAHLLFVIHYSLDMVLLSLCLYLFNLQLYKVIKHNIATQIIAQAKHSKSDVKRDPSQESRDNSQKRRAKNKMLSEIMEQSSMSTMLLETITKATVLSFVIIFFSLFLGLNQLSHFFGGRLRIYPSIMTFLDSFVNCLFIYLGFSLSQKWYNMACSVCHKQLQKCFKICIPKALGADSFSSTSKLTTNTRQTMELSGTAEAPQLTKIEVTQISATPNNTSKEAIVTNINIIVQQTEETEEGS